MLLHILLILILLVPPDTTASADTVRERITIKPQLFPTSFYSDAQGFGVGVGIDVENLIWPGTYLDLAARPAEHRGIYRASFYTSDPYRSRAYGLLSLDYTVTGVQRYYGLGPGSVRAAKMDVERESIEGEARAGFQTFGGHVLIQPGIRVVRHIGHGFDEVLHGASQALDSTSMQHLTYVTRGEASVLTGIVPGLELAHDARDVPENPSRGHLITIGARRFLSMGSLGLTFDTFYGSLYGFIPIDGQKEVLSLRAALMTTQNRGHEDIPFFLLPSLDRELFPGFTRNRFYGNDLLLLTTEYRRYLLTVPLLGRIEAMASVGVGNTYDDVFRQFRPTVSLDENFPHRARGYPMRAAFGIGGRALSVSTGRVRVSGMVGLSPEGFSLVSFRFVQDLRRVRSPLR